MAAGGDGRGSAVLLVFGASSPLARAVVERLEGRGHQVATVGDDGVALASEAEVERAVEQACGQQSLTAVVHVDAPADAGIPRPLVGLDGDDWDEHCEAVVRRTLLAFQAAHRRLGPGGSLVLVVPSIALTGAAGFSAWSAAAEAQRVMAKVAARRWGSRGITVNVVSVPPALLCDGPDGALALLGRTKAPPALGEEACTPGAAADLACLLLGPDARALTGSTLVADGGQLMLP